MELGRIAHAYLFSGPRGVGKTSAARILAKALNCEKGPTAEPCGHCSLCSEIAGGNSLDVIEIDGASNTSVNDVRELKDEVLFAPNSSRYKIYIIDEVHMLSNSAFNALLKTIEEPPPYIVFIFATTEIHKVPATIRSRCQQFNFRLISVEIIKEKLRETAEELHLAAEDEALFWIAKEATGSLRDAYTLFDQIASFSEKKITLTLIQEKLGLVGIDAINDIAQSMVDENGSEVIKKAQDIFSQGVAIEQFIIDLSEYFRNILLLSRGIDRETILGFPASRFSPRVVEAFNPSQLEYALGRLFELYRNLRFSLNQRFETELVLSDLSSLRRRISHTALVGRIEELRKELYGGRAASKGRDHSPDGAAPSKPPSIDSREAAAPAEHQQAEHQQAETGEKPSAQRKGLTQDEISALIVELKDKPSLASALQKVQSWQTEGSVLRISSDSGYSANKIRAELPTLTQLLKKITGKNLDVRVNSGGEKPSEGEAEDEDSHAELVKKVFRGQIVENGGSNESNGPI
jgi:DNA polymerase III subunit gamma/tau